MIVDAGNYDRAGCPARALVVAEGEVIAADKQRINGEDSANRIDI